MQKCKAFTLIEVIAVLIIVSILVVVAIPNYQKAIEQARDKEAIACLRLIQAGERIYRSKIGQYYPVTSSGTSDLVDINNSLVISLNARTWRYVINPGSGAFRAIAARQNPPSGFNRQWEILNRDCNQIFGGAYCVGDCPPSSQFDSTLCP